MSITILNDEDVSSLLNAQLAVDTIEEALMEYQRGILHAPARLLGDLGGGELVFTCGAFADGYGFRAYDTFNSPTDDQVTVAWDRKGNLQGVIVGRELGRRRTGALGAAAARRLFSVDQPLTIGVIGAGAQAFAQLWAISAIRTISHVLSFRRDPRANRSFAARVEQELGLACRDVADPRETAQNCDLLIVATGAASPVIDAVSIKPTTVVFTLGPKRIDSHELPTSVYERANLLITDAPQQIAAEGHASIVSQTSVKSLTDFVPDSQPPRGPCVYLSAGLAGTEVFLASKLLGA